MQGRHRPASVAGSERRLREIEMIFERAQLVTISATLLTKITKSTRPASSQLEDWAARQRRGHDPRHNKKRVELIAILHSSAAVAVALVTITSRILSSRREVAQRSSWRGYARAATGR